MTYKTSPPCGHEQSAKDCVRCFHWRATPKYRIAHGGDPEGFKATAVPPCIHRGSPVRPPAAKAGCSSLYVICDHPKQPLGPVVCFCEGCGPKCRGYEVETTIEKGSP